MTLFTLINDALDSNDNMEALISFLLVNYPPITITDAHEHPDMKQIFDRSVQKSISDLQEYDEQFIPIAVLRYVIMNGNGNYNVSNIPSWPRFVDRYHPILLNV
jgi:hypothetical protein